MGTNKKTNHKIFPEAIWLIFSALVLVLIFTSGQEKITFSISDNQREEEYDFPFPDEIDFKKLADEVTCHPGEKKEFRPFVKKYFCYKPTGFEGKSCYKKGDCGGGYCIAENYHSYNKEEGGVCVDNIFACIIEFDKKGEPGEICYD